MNTKTVITILAVSLTTLFSCSQNKEESTADNTKQVEVVNKPEVKSKEPHQYGGWYCPDNLNGFPAVDIQSWDKVPVVNGRMATKEETRNGTSLMFIDPEKYPDAKTLDIEMPKLATYYSDYTKKDELIIVIQAIEVQGDSVVGFRYLNGGNGSAWLNEVNFLSDNDIDGLSPASFVTLDININATQDQIWKIITKPEYTKILQPIFDKDLSLKSDWKKDSKVNFKYIYDGVITSEIATNLYGNMYAQIDYDLNIYPYTEKFLLLEDKDKKTTDLKIVCGPYNKDYETQKSIITEWAQKVKGLSEKL